MNKFIAKPHTWFKEGTEAKLVAYLTVDTEGNKYGIFEGKNKDGKLVREVCPYDEFDIAYEV